MSQTINGLKIATEEELLEFANSVRMAGGADIIGALLPSTPRAPGSCLIANALNFSCEVNTSGSVEDTFASGAYHWYMFLPANMTTKRAHEIADLVPGVRVRRVHKSGERDLPAYLALSLPEHIGNAALAFDEGTAFDNYRIGWCF